MDYSNATLIDANYFGKIKPDAVLVEYNGPNIFTFLGKDSKEYFAYLIDEEEAKYYYLIVPTSKSRTDKLIHGTMSLLEMINQPWGWIASIENDSQPKSVHEIDPTYLPIEYLPTKDAYLPGTNPIDLAIKLTGEDMSEESVPLSSLKYASEKAIATINSLCKYVVHAKGLQQFDDRRVREFSDWQVHRFTMASLEVDMRLPKQLSESSDPLRGEQQILVSEVSRLLGKMVRWTANPELMEADNNNPAENTVVLTALKELTPSGKKKVQEVTLSGRIVHEQSLPSVKLQKDLRTPILKSLKSNIEKLQNKTHGIRLPELIKATGKVDLFSNNSDTFEMYELTSVDIIDDDGEETQEMWPYGERIEFSFGNKWRGIVIRYLESKQDMTVVGELSKKVSKAHGKPYYRVASIRSQMSLFDESDGDI